MEETAVIKVIAEIRSDFPTKFGIPRQSGLVPELEALVVFRPEYRVPEALRGIEGYSHLWLAWGIFRNEAGGLAAYRASAPAGRQPASRGICQPVTVPPQCHWAFLRQAAGGGAPSRMGHGAAGSRG